MQWRLQTNIYYKKRYWRLVSDYLKLRNFQFLSGDLAAMMLMGMYCQRVLRQNMLAVSYGVGSALLASTGRQCEGLR